MYLVTGCAGFIGMHLCQKLLQNKNKVIGIDNINNYYDTGLKIQRLNNLKNFLISNFTKLILQILKT